MSFANFGVYSWCDITNKAPVDFVLKVANGMAHERLVFDIEQVFGNFLQ